MFKTLRRVINLYGVHKKRIYFGLVCSTLNAVFSSFTIMAFLWVLLHIQSDDDRHLANSRDSCRDRCRKNPSQIFDEHVSSGFGICRFHRQTS